MKTLDSATIVFDQFVELMENEKYEEALDFYLKEKTWFFVYLELSTNQFNFHKEIIIPLIFKYNDDDTALEESIKILEMNLLMTETVIALSDGNNIPTHYGELLGILKNLYVEAERYEDALSMVDKALENVNNQFNELTDEHAFIYYDKAACYIYLNNYSSALEFTLKAISVLEKLQMQDDELYNDCLGMIALIEEKSK